MHNLNLSSFSGDPQRDQSLLDFFHDSETFKIFIIHQRFMNHADQDQQKDCDRGIGRSVDAYDIPIRCQT